MEPQQRYFRKIIRIQATDSPNVQRALAMQAKGLEPDDRVVTPGVITWDIYRTRLREWDEIKQCVGLRGQFYKGKEVFLYPSSYLRKSEELADQLRGVPRTGKRRGLGVDSAEGGDKTSLTVVDDQGVIYQESKKTPNTAVINPWVKAVALKYQVRADNICYDRGGGGTQLADMMRKDKWPVKTVGFGEKISLDPKRGLTLIETKMEVKEDRYVYVNRRAQLYGELSILMDPFTGPGFAIPREYQELIRQLSLMPKLYTDEGRLEMLPKNKREDPEDPRSRPGREKTLTQIIGHSPDEADSLVLAVFAMQQKPKMRAGAVL